MEFICFDPQRSFFSLRGSDIHIAPLIDPYYSNRLREAIRNAAGVHCVCNEILDCAQEFAGRSLANSRVIYTALAQYFLSARIKQEHENYSDVPLHIISVARLDWRKGFEHGFIAI